MLINKFLLLRTNRFLYGGPGLWRSASLKGSDPVLLVAQSSFDETINTRSQRTGSLSGINQIQMAYLRLPLEKKHGTL